MKCHTAIDSATAAAAVREMEEEHASYYGLPCGSKEVVAEDGKVHKCGLDHERFVSKEEWTWTTSGGNIITISKSDSDEWLLLYQGRRHGFIHVENYFPSAMTFPWRVSQSRNPELKPWETTS